MVDLLFSFKGRINRLQYWGGALVVGVVGFVALMMLVLTTGSSLATSKPDPAAALSAIAGFAALLLPLLFVMGWCNLALQTKRLHDRGRSGLLTLLPFVVIVPMFVTLTGAAMSGADASSVAMMIQPYMGVLSLINLYFFVDLGCLGSVEGPNKYGDPPGSPRSPDFDAPVKAPSAPQAKVAVTTALFGAQTAMERAITEQGRTPHLQRKIQPSAPLPPRPAPAPGVAPTFGRRVTR